jgi:hypothetical protein
MDNKTAVDWFMGKIGEKQPNGLYIIDTLYDVQNLYQQAKEMEKEQHRITAQDFYYGSHSFKNFEQYYNETYGKNHIGDANEMVGGEQ